ncbi:hypothetical protein CAOG_05238 [Capsaspora owczarzaki ATCC 30864]|nr:hypothetical protein CAOG_05238 [Capsaspora owczarzaki ATCC 30864]|eukprot:XP_004346923.2 hypothetical protein CAOG_05238 [Capsaspora owczarzaki ATCC 30864]
MSDTTYYVLVGLYLALAVFGFIGFVIRRHHEPIRSRGIVLSLVSTMFGSLFFIAQSFKLSDPESVQCGFMWWVSALNTCTFAAPYFMRCCVVYFKFMWNNEKLKRQTAFFHRHRWMIRWYSGVGLICLLIFFHVIVQVGVSSNFPNHFPPSNITVADEACDLDPQQLAQNSIIVLYCVVGIFIGIMLRLNHVSDAFYIKLELGLMVAWIVPLFVGFFLVLVSKPDNFEAPWLQMVAYTLTLLISIYFPLIMSFFDSDTEFTKSQSFGDIAGLEDSDDLQMHEQQHDSDSGAFDSGAHAYDGQANEASEGVIHVTTEDVDGETNSLASQQRAPASSAEVPASDTLNIIDATAAFGSISNLMALANSSNAAAASSSSTTTTTHDDHSHSKHEHAAAATAAEPHASNEVVVAAVPAAHDPQADAKSVRSNRSGSSVSSNNVANTKAPSVRPSPKASPLLPRANQQHAATPKKPEADAVSVNSRNGKNQAGRRPSTSASIASSIITETLDVVLTNAIYLDAFKKFCVQSWCAENINFYDDYVAYKAKGEAVTRQDLDRMCEMYIKRGASNEINIPQTLQTATLKKISEAHDGYSTLLDTVYRAVRRHLNQDVFPRFRKSQLFKAARKQAITTFQPV